MGCWSRLALAGSVSLGLGCSGASATDDLGLTEGAFHEASLKPAYAIELESKVVMTYPSTRDKRYTYKTRIVGRVATKAGTKNEATLSVKPCAITLPPAGGFQPTVPDEAFENVADFVLHATIDDEDMKSKPVAMLLGVRGLADPLRSPLPKDEGDTRVFDQDRDGKPGFSVYVGGGRVFVGMRVVASLSGELKRGGEIEGEADVDVDSEVYGDTILFVDVKSQVESAEKGHVVSKKNTFRMVPLPTAATCGAAIDAVGR